MTDFVLTLQQVGCSAEESKIFEFLLGFSGGTTAGELSKRVQKPRASVYALLKRLHTKGLVQISQQSGVLRYACISQSALEALFTKKQTAITDSLGYLPDLYHSFLKDSSYNTNNRMEFFDGIDGLKHVLRNMLLYRNIETFTFWPISPMIDTLGSGFFETLNKERVQRKIYTKALWPLDSVVSLKKHPYMGHGVDFYREIRIAPKGVDCDFGYWSFQDYVAFVSPKHEAFGFVIQSAALVQMLKTQWQFIWNLSDPFVDNSTEPTRFIDSIHNR